MEETVVPLSPSVLDDLPYSVDPMRVADIDEVMLIDRQAFSTPWSHNAYHYEIERNDAAHYMVLRPRSIDAARRIETGWERVRRWLGAPAAHDHAPILGYGGLWLMYDEAHISTIAMRPDWRGRGLGELLLVGLMLKSMALNAQVVTLEVRVGNTRAQQLYRKYEFEIVGRRRKYYTDNGEDALLMTTPSLHDEGYQEHLVELGESLRERLLGEGQPAEQRA